MSNYSVLSYGLFATAVVLAYRDNIPSSSPPSISDVAKDALSKSAKTKEIVETLNYCVYLIKAGKTALKWTKKGVKQVAAAIDSGIFTESLTNWCTSRKALRVYALFIGSCLLSYQNKKPKELRVNSLLKESKEIIDVYELITSTADFIQNPRRQVIPIACALVMIGSRYFIPE